MRELRRFYRKKVKKHRLFIAASLVLALALLMALVVAPATESGGPWHIPQVRPDAG